MKAIACTIGLALIALVPQMARACSCAPPPPPKQALEAAAAVFSGKVIEIKQEGGEFAPKQVKFEIAKTWKGTEGKNVVVTTAAQDSLCGFDFVKGKSYLVYCYGEKDKLATNICTRTKALGAAADDIKELGQGKAP